MYQTLVAFLGIGMIVGILAGLLGVGGGLVIVPVLLAAFMAQAVPQSVAVHLAAGTSLATICITSFASMHAHHRHGVVRWSEVIALTPGLILGAVGGAMLAKRLPGEMLRILFGLFVLSVAVQMGFGLRPSPHRQLPGSFGIYLVGALIGMVSALVGIGGGSLTVPFLTRCNVPVREAVGTSAACGLPIALAGAMGFMVSGWEVTGLPPYSTGFVYWPAFAGIVVTSIAFVGVGAQWAHRLPARLLQRLFALFLCGVGLLLLK